MSGQSQVDSPALDEAGAAGNGSLGPASVCRWQASSEFLLLGLWTLLVAGVFWPFLSGQSLVGYRDAVQFYWPMFQWADEVWAGGETPFWNPYDGLGRSHLAEGVSSLFYPGKLVFWCRWLPFESRLGCYQALHVWLAGWGAARLAGRFGAGPIGSGLSMLMYGLAGPVLFAATNVVYLVSAAWLPWGLGAVWLWQQNRRKSGLATSAAAALMVLGGDPQMAGNLLLIAAASWCWWSWKSVEPGRRWRALAAAGANWLGVFLLMCGLAAIQIIPSLNAATGSARAEYLLPRTLPEWLLSSFASGTPQTFSGITGEPGPGTHLADAYEFSQPPWTVLEWIWPGSSGRPFPVWTHWASSLPGAGRMWQPSLYQGAWCLFLACVAARCREFRWLVCLGILSAAASCGWYGPVWLFNEIGLATDWWEPLTGWNRGMGGVYWWLVSIIPGYVWFRYPAKLVVVTALALAVLAGCGWTRLEPRRWGRGMLALSACSLILILATSWVPWDRVGAAAIGDEWFGPLDGRQLRGQLTAAGAQTLALSLLGWGLWSRWREALGRRSAGWIGLGLLAADLLVANVWLLAAVPCSPSSSILTKKSHANELPVYWSSPEFPREWRLQGSENRLEEVVAWETKAAFPRMHWLWGERMLNAPATIERDDWLDFLEWVQAASSGNQEDARIQAADLLSWKMLFDSKRVWLLSPPLLRGAVLEEGAGEADCSLGFRQGWVSGVSHSAEELGVALEPERTELEAAGEVVSRSRQSVTVRVSLERAGVAFLAEAFAPGWQVIVRDLTVGRVLRRDCVSVGGWLRGVELAPGEYELRFEYTPPGFYLAMGVSFLSWVLVAALYFGRYFETPV